MRLSDEELELERRMEALARLARTVAHDFNNVLLVVRGYGELLTMRLDDGHPARAQAEKIVAEAERAVGFTGHLLSFGREAALEVRDLELAAELERLHAELAPVLGPAIALDVHASDAPRVRADPEALAWILRELAANARDAMPEGGRVTVEAETADGRARLSFADTGRGMDEDTSRRAFEPMFTTKEPGAGPGLGLSLVYALARQQGGRAAVASVPGAGTTVTIDLPLADTSGV